MRYERPGRINWPRIISTLEDSGLPRRCICNLAGTSKTQLARLASTTKKRRCKDPKHQLGAALLELYNWRMDHIIGRDKA